MLERQIQDLIRFHPYLLDTDLSSCGRIERTVQSGRIDIDFQTFSGTVVVECKITPLKDSDILQLKRYLKDLLLSGEKVVRAYLIGASPIRPLNTTLMEGTPPITVRELHVSIPLQLSLCRNGHYFDADFHACPYDGAPKIHGKDILIS